MEVKFKKKNKTNYYTFKIDTFINVVRAVIKLYLHLQWWAMKKLCYMFKYNR